MAPDPGAQDGSHRLRLGSRRGASNRTTDSAAWHRSLENVINVDEFLNWLAVNTAVYNWDTYGALAHNYFLYNDAGRFRWIAYDIAFCKELVLGGRSDNARQE